MQDGIAHVYLAAVPRMAAANGAMLAHVTSMKEVTVVDCASTGPGMRCRLAVEPEALALGPGHLAAVAQGKARSRSILLPTHC